MPFSAAANSSRTSSVRLVVVARTTWSIDGLPVAGNFSSSHAGDEFGVSGTGEACMEHFGLTARGITDRAREALVLKPIVSRAPRFGPEWT